MTPLGSFAMRGIAAFLACGAISSPVQALTDEELACAVEAISPEEASGVFERVLAGTEGGAGESGPMFEEVFACVERHGIDRDVETAFFEYSLTTVVWLEARRRLVDLGLDVDEIDSRLDVGPDLSNPLVDELDDVQQAFILERLRELDLELAARRSAVLTLMNYLFAARHSFAKLAELR